ncbi:hypothetical protein LTR17_027276 [Elasticomyces elasticus]|nr:hypothetical protein LTR17_027276 [Elasticomyces elasticus]
MTIGTRDLSTTHSDSGGRIIGTKALCQHNDEVQRVATAVRSYYERHQPFRIFHGSTNSTRPIRAGPVVDISRLSRVLCVDAAAGVVVVEPNVPMDKLVQATLAHGMIPPIVMEFPGITVGGGYAGSAGESSSFRHGYFDQTVESVEIVLASGEIVNASSCENTDLLNGAAGSLGTLGITTKLEVALVPAKTYVKLDYRPFCTVRETIQATLEATMKAENDYVDAILFSTAHGVVMTGRLVDDLPKGYSPQTFSGSWDPWFYKHVQAKSITQATTDYIPIAEYLFRYDRAGFWVGADAFKYFCLTPHNRFIRWLLDDFMHTRMLFRALHASNMSFGHMVQDLSLPYSTVESFIDWCANQLSIWPLWLCPLRTTQAPTFHPQTSDAAGIPQPMLNIGLWGRASFDLSTFVEQNRVLEARLVQLGGRKVLYSHTYYTEEEFWALYDERWYNALRQKYVATSLPTVYEKVRVDLTEKGWGGRVWWQRIWDTWPFPGIWGVWYALRSGDYKIHRPQPGWKYWEMNQGL